MPQVDLETLVSSVCLGGGDRDSRAAAAAGSSDHDDPNTRPVSELESLLPPQDFPPESYFLSKEDELDWVIQNAFLERKDSQKGNSAGSNQNANSSCQQTALKVKAFITGLPNPQKTFSVESKNRRHHGKFGQTRLISDLVGSRGRKGTLSSEPSSPNVSCMGRVRSERNRRMRRGKSGRPDSMATGSKSGSVNRVGFFSSFRAIFSFRRCKCKQSSSAHHPVGSLAESHDIRRRLPPDDVCAISSPVRKEEASRKSFEVKPVGNTGLGGMNRFASGRREDLLGAVNVAKSTPHDLESRRAQS